MNLDANFQELKVNYLLSSTQLEKFSDSDVVEQTALKEKVQLLAKQMICWKDFSSHGNGGQFIAQEFTYLKQLKRLHFNKNESDNDVQVNSSYKLLKSIKRFREADFFTKLDQGKLKLTDFSPQEVASFKRRDAADEFKGDRAIHAFIKNGDAVGVSYLLNSHAINSTNSYDETPLIMASRKVDNQMVKTLLDNGADVHLSNKQGVTPLHATLKNEEAGDNNLKLVTTLLTAKANVNASDIRQQTPLHLAVDLGCIDITTTLIDSQADINACDTNLITPLHLAANIGDEKTIHLLLEKQANINAIDHKKNTPLHEALSEDNINILETVSILLNSKADVNAACNWGFSPLHFASEIGEQEVVNLLLENKADINQREKNGSTPLFSATQLCHTDITRTLLAHQADINVRDNFNSSVLHYAIEKDHKPIVEMLLEQPINVNVKDHSGCTPLHYAVNSSNRIVRLLIDNNADVNAIDNITQTPCFKATTRNNHRAVKMLLESDADVTTICSHVTQKKKFCEKATVLQIAQARNFSTIIKLILEAQKPVLETKESAPNRPSMLGKRRADHTISEGTKRIRLESSNNS